jgi:hypothetical protein
VPRSELAARLASIACNSAAQCCQSSGQPFDKDACQRGYGAELAENIDEIDSSRVAYDADAAGDCLDSVADTVRCGDFEEVEAEVCERIFVGKVPAGQPCENSSECQQQSGARTTCTGNGDGGASVCTPIFPAPHGKLNEACGITCYEGSSCFVYTSQSSSDPSLRTGCYRDEGLFCAAGTCQAVADVGGACSGGDSCKRGSFCDFRTALCVAVKPDGATCSSSQECQSERCMSDDASGAPSAEPVVSHCRSRDTVDADLCSEDFDDDDAAP